MKKLMSKVKYQWVNYQASRLYKQVDALHFEANNLIRNGRRDEALMLLEKANHLRMKLMP
jgi:hypothetical protein